MDTDETSEVSAQSGPTQISPTFSRADLGAALFPSFTNHAPNNTTDTVGISDGGKRNDTTTPQDVVMINACHRNGGRSLVKSPRRNRHESLPDLVVLSEI